MAIYSTSYDKSLVAMVQAMDEATRAAKGYTLDGDKVIVRTHEGLVLENTGTHYQGLDVEHSIALVWDAEKGAPVSVVYATNHYDYGGTWGKCEVDAPAEVVAAWDAYRAAKRAADEAARFAAEQGVLRKGRVVRVVKGRKVAKGTEGVIVWIGRDQYARAYWRQDTSIEASPALYRVGIKLADGTVVYTSGGNVETVKDAEGAAIVRAPGAKAA